MTPNRVNEGSLRPGRLEMSGLAIALAVSLLFHGGVWGSYKLAKEMGWLQMIHVPAWLHKTKMFAKTDPKKDQDPQMEIPLTFVDVNPVAATAEPPKDAKFYSDKNSKAANKEADLDTNIPKIDGKQTDIVKAEDVPRNQFDKLQPAVTRADEAQTAELAKPKTPETPGDLVMAKPDTTLRPDNGTAERPRPQTIKEALLRQNRNQLLGEKMKQDGGTSRFQLVPSFDTKATPFGMYDAAFIAAVENRWIALLDNMSYDGYRRGRVVLQFHLNPDGRISDMKVLENNVGETLGLLCQKAVLDPSPFDKWPREMRLLVDKDYRDIQFAFYYN
jgi:hypothetical protein